MSGPSSSRTSGRSRRPGGGSRSRFRDEVRVEDPPPAPGSRPFGFGSKNLDPLMEERPVEYEGLELSAFAARMHAAGSLQAKEVLDCRCIPTATEPTRVKALRRDARKDDVETGSQVIPDESPWIVSPKGGENPEARLRGGSIDPLVLVVRRNRSDHDTVHVDASEDPPQGIQFAFLSPVRFLRNQGTLHRVGEERGHVQIRNVEEHRLAILRKDREEMRELPSALDRGIRGIRRILATGEKRRDLHRRCKGHPREKDSERMSQPYSRLTFRPHVA